MRSQVSVEVETAFTPADTAPRLRIVTCPSVDSVPEMRRLLLLVADFVITRRPHEVSMKEAIGWSAFYVALPLAFGLYVWSAHGGDRGLEYYTGPVFEAELTFEVKDEKGNVSVNGVVRHQVLTSDQAATVTVASGASLGAPLALA